ncbi:MAG: CoA transferase [Proteobacteria bacterium]|nr:CoA transferase [Pseudomonadota bacterium]
MSDPLSGIKVLDLTRVLSGPFATMTLADLGADVVKVERATGDDTRGFGPPYSGGVATYYLAVNRGKRSMVADLKDPVDVETVRELASAADVVVENFRPGVMERLGLGYARLAEDNPALVYCSISGFGHDEPGAGYDLVIQGLSGIPSVTGDGTGEPWKCGTSIADLVAGMNAVQGILAALVRRERTGEGAFVDISMIDGQLALLSYHASAFLNAGVEPRAKGNAHPSIHPYQPYRASDGWVNVACGTNRMFASLCRELDVDWDVRWPTNADRVAARAELDAGLAPRMAEDTVASWVDRLNARGVPSGAMASVPIALSRARPVEHEHPDGEQTVRSLPPGFRLSDARHAARRGPPALGSDRDAVLKDWLE